MLDAAATYLGEAFTSLTTSALPASASTGEGDASLTSSDRSMTFNVASATCFALAENSRTRVLRNRGEHVVPCNMAQYIMA